MKKITILFLILVAAQASAERQTVFNDDNYTPKEITNTMPKFQAQNYRSSSHTRQKPRAQIITRNWQKQVKSGYGPRWENGQFQYRLYQGTIATADTCNNYQYGSLKYRTCRVAAKEHFIEQCKNGYKPACTAKDMRP